MADQPFSFNFIHVLCFELGLCNTNSNHVFVFEIVLNYRSCGRPKGSNNYKKLSGHGGVEIELTPFNL